MIQLITAIDQSALDDARNVFAQHVDSTLLQNYRLPVASTDTHLIIGLSGGADSSVLAIFAAIFLTPIYPNIHYLFTDTKAEPASCYETLNRLESFLGINITRLMPELGLFELIDKNNGFLPGTK